MHVLRLSLPHVLFATQRTPTESVGDDLHVREAHQMHIHVRGHQHLPVQALRRGLSSEKWFFTRPGEEAQIEADDEARKAVFAKAHQD